MIKKTGWIVTLCGLGCATLGWGAVEQPPIKGTPVVQEVSAAGELRTEIQRLAEQQRGPLWIGYEVPLVSALGGLCCTPGSDCALESESGHMVQTRQDDRSPHPGLMVFLRVHQGEVTQVRSFTTDCSIDAGGLPTFWVRNVDPDDSVALLGSLVRPQTFDTMTHAAMFAVAAHAGKAADEALHGIFRTTKSPAVREEVVTRLGNVRGRGGFESLRVLLEGEENAVMRQLLLFGIVMSHEPEAEDVILRFAREDRDAAVRSWALLHYAQAAGRRALPVLSEAIARDPAREVRSTAVMALKHLPEEDKDDARKFLEDLARQSADPELRREAKDVLNLVNGCLPGASACSSR